MTQQPLFDIPSSQIENHSPALDAVTVRQLRAVGIVYCGTHWNSWFKWFEHEVELNMGRGAYRLRKTDQGIAALLKELA